MAKPVQPDPSNIPDVVVDAGKNKRYKKGKFLGKVCLNLKVIAYFE